MDRRTAFALVMFNAIMFDMISTLIVLQAGFLESNAVIWALYDLHPLLLIVWAALWLIFIYAYYPIFERYDLKVQFESCCMFFTLLSIFAGIHNFSVVTA